MVSAPNTMSEQKKIVSVRFKILGVFLLLILFFAINILVNHIFGKETQEATHRISNIDQPTIIELKNFDMLITKSQNDINNWVSIDLDIHPDKNELRQIHAEDWSIIRRKLETLSQDWENENETDSLEAIFVKFEQVIQQEKIIMNDLLHKFEAYDDFQNRFRADELLDSINASTAQIQVDLDWLLKEQEHNTNISEEALNDAAWLSWFTNSVLGIIVIAIALVIAIFLSRSISNPIVKLQKIINKLSRGELPDPELKTTNDEIGEMVTEVKTLVSGLKRTSNFAKEICSGQLDAQFIPMSENDVLGNSLLTMRDNLKEIAIEDERRNWSNEGYAQFGEILRNSDNGSLKELSDKIVSALVKYLNANQGWLYVVNNDTQDTEEEPYLELYGCFAYNRKKHLEQKVYMGDGLTGQSWQEGEYIFMNDVPQNYTQITSGLGEATPTCILIMPLKVNDKIHGIFELASFQELKPHEINFVSRIAENTASTISVTRNNELTKYHLEESQQLAQSLRSQEEEMRQSFEEMHSTQEEMNRREEEMQKRIDDLEARLG